MKKYLTALLIPVTMLSLMATAYADVIAGPMIALYWGTRLLPWVLVGAVVGVTVFLLQKFRNRRK